MEDYIEHNHVTAKAKRLFSFSSSDKNKREGLEVEMNSEDVAEANASQITSHRNVKVTFHQRELFLETFKEYFEDYEIIERSLSPEKNRD